MSTMVLAELITWVAIAVADLGFSGARQDMEVNLLQPIETKQVQPTLDHTMQMMNGGKPLNLGGGSLQSSLDQAMDFLNSEKSPMGPNWPPPSLDQTVQMMNGGKPEDMGAGLQSAVDQMLDYIGGKQQGIGAGSLQSPLGQMGQAVSVMNDWLDILRNETSSILDDLKQHKGPLVQIPLNQTTVKWNSVDHCTL